MCTGSRLSFLVAAATLASASPVQPPALQRRAVGPTGPNVTIVQMFQWSWDSIASECTDFLGPAGYGYVQGTSPSEFTFFLLLIRCDPLCVVHERLTNLFAGTGVAGGWCWSWSVATY